jgi:hypothetical protein
MQILQKERNLVPRILKLETLKEMRLVNDVSSTVKVKTLKPHTKPQLCSLVITN